MECPYWKNSDIRPHSTSLRRMLVIRTSSTGSRYWNHNKEGLRSATTHILTGIFWILILTRNVKACLSPTLLQLKPCSMNILIIHLYFIHIHTVNMTMCLRQYWRKLHIYQLLHNIRVYYSKNQTCLRSRAFRWAVPLPPSRASSKNRRCTPCK